MEITDHNSVDYQRILNLSLDLICIAGMDGYFKYLNPAWENILGYTRDELLSKPFLDFIHPDDHAKNEEEVAKLVAGYQTIDFENRYVHKDGSIRYVSWTAQPVADEKAMYCIGRDITVRKQAEEALQESEDKYSKLFNTVPDAIMVFNAETREFIDANDAVPALYGYSKEEFLDLRHTDITAEPEESDESIKKTLNGEINRIPLRYHKRKDGTIFPLEISTGTFKLGNRQMVYGVTRDITERMQAEETLKESEERLKALSDASFEAIFLSDKGVCLDQNRTAERMFGYTHTEAVGRHGTEWIVPEDREQVKNNMLSGYEKPYEVTALQKNGTTFPCEIQARMIKYQGRPIRITALRDITERKQAEEALRESEEKFRSIVENLPMGLHMYQLNPDGQLYFIGANPAADKILGVDNTQFLGKTIYEAFPKIHETEIPERFRIIAEKGGFWKNEDIIYKDENIEGAFENYNFQTSPGKMVSLFLETTERKQAEDALQKAHDELEQRVEERTKELKIKTKSLEELNTAMKVLLEKRIEDKIKLEDNVMKNTKELIGPLIVNMRETELNEHQKMILSILESNLDEITSNFTRKLSLEHLNLTPTEMKIANLIKHGTTTKEIAEIMKSSPRTIETHRKNIREKVGLKQGRRNLRSYLLSLH